MDKLLFVYIVRCSDDSYYTGITNDIVRRIAEHNNGINKHCYTFARRPVDLLFTESFQYYNQALDFEKQVKRWSRRKKEALIRGDWDMIVMSAQNANKP